MRVQELIIVHHVSKAITLQHFTRTHAAQ